MVPGDASSIVFAFSGVGDELSRGSGGGIAGELDTSEVIAGERSERSANLLSREMEGTADAFDAVNDGAVVGTQGGGGIRCCSSTTIRNESQNRNKKKTLTRLI